MDAAEQTYDTFKLFVDIASNVALSVEADMAQILLFFDVLHFEKRTNKRILALHVLQF